MNQLPTFTPRSVYADPERKREPRLNFECVACRELTNVDVDTGCCRNCWRLTVLLPAAMKVEAAR